MTKEEFRKGMTKRKLYHQLLKTSLYGKGLDDFTDQLKECKEEHPGYDSYSVSIETESAYYDSVNTYFVLEGRRMESDEDLDNRLGKDYSIYLAQQARKRLDLERLKKELE